MSELRIGFVVPHYWPSVDQHARVCGQLAAGLAAAGADVTVITPQHDRRWPVAAKHRGVNIIRMRKPARDQHAVKGIGKRRLAVWLKSHASAFDVVLVSGLKGAAAAAVRATRSLKLPVALRAESAGLSGDCHWQINSRLGQRYKKWCMKADALIATGPAVYEELIAAGYPRPRIHLCQSGVELPQIGSDEDIRKARRAIADSHPALQVATGAPFVVSIGPLSSEQNQQLLVDGWPSVLARFPMAKLWIVGEGPLLPELQQRVDQLKLTDSVLLPGSFHEMQELLTAADLLVWPAADAATRHEQLESLAAAKPIILADTPTSRDLTGDTSAAQFVAGQTSADWSQAILQLLSDPQTAAEIGQKARARAVEHFSFSSMIESHLDVLGKVVRDSR
mgnify:CR=1 FL=1